MAGAGAGAGDELRDKGEAVVRAENNNFGSATLAISISIRTIVIRFFTFYFYVPFLNICWNRQWNKFCDAQNTEGRVCEKSFAFKKQYNERKKTKQSL